jgi:hypothetical protein
MAMTTRHAHESRPRPPTPEAGHPGIRAGSPRPFRVLVGVDFSGASLAAARWVARAFGPSADLVLVNVLPAVARAGAVIRTGRSESRDDARAMLGALRGLAGLLGVGRVEAVVRRGAVPDVLAAVAARVRARYVCIGRDAVDALPALRLAERLLGGTSAGVIVVPASADAAPSRMVAVVDGGPGSASLLREAAGVLARVAAAPTSRDTARLTVVHRSTDDSGASGRVVPVADIRGPGRPSSARALGRWTRNASAWLAHRVPPAMAAPRSAEALRDPSLETGPADARTESAASPPSPRAPAVDLLVLARRYRTGGRANDRLDPATRRGIGATGAPGEVRGTVRRGSGTLDPVVRVALGQATCPVLVVPRSRLDPPGTGTSPPARLAEANTTTRFRRRRHSRGRSRMLIPDPTWRI